MTVERGEAGVHPSEEGFVEVLEARELESAKNSPALLEEHVRVTGVSE